MTGKLTTHVLDTSSGLPAAGMRIDLSFSSEGDDMGLASTRTNADGRPDAPLLEAGLLQPGLYRLEFHVADYFRDQGNPDAGKFLELVTVVFRIDNPAGKYHVPLLVSPWSYSTYRGS